MTQEHAKPIPIKEEKIEVDYDYFEDFLQPLPDLDPEVEPDQEPVKRSRKKIKQDKDDDENWTPNVVPKRTRKNGVAKQERQSKGASFIRKNEQLLRSYEHSKPLTEYKVPPCDTRMKKNIGSVDYSKEFSCDMCSGRFATEKIMFEHMTRMHEEHFDCPYCNHSFRLDEEEKFKLHLFKHDHKLLNSTACVQCGKFFRQPSHYRNHLKVRGTYHDDQCTQCPVKFSTYEEYKDHVKKEHQDVWQYKCGFCKELYDDEKDLKGHVDFAHLGKGIKNKVKSKNEPIEEKVCEECGKHVKFLTIHMNTVHQDQKLPCPHCQLCFKTKIRLKKHIQTMHEKAPCSQCGEMVGIAKMWRHVASKHTPATDRRFKCDVCGKSFIESARLKDHKNIHTGEKPYKCKFCNACFASAGTHAMHQRSHLGHRRSK